jgi:hypothetical protein
MLDSDNPFNPSGILKSAHLNAENWNHKNYDTERKRSINLEVLTVRYRRTKTKCTHCRIWENCNTVLRYE